MNVRFLCPKCDQTVRTSFRAGAESIECPRCGETIRVSTGRWDGDKLRGCLVCPSTELFVRKDFPQRLGVGLFIAGVIASTIAWAYTNLWWTFGILLGSAMLDFLLYFVVGEVLACYRCHAEYRGVADIDEHGGFDLATHERHRQSAARTTGSKN